MPYFSEFEDEIFSDNTDEDLDYEQHKFGEIFSNLNNISYFSKKLFTKINMKDKCSNTKIKI